MEKTKEKLIIVGDSAFAQIAYEYFTYDSPYEVVAFSVEKEFLKRKELFGLPIVPFEELEKLYDPEKHKIFVALTYTQLNRVRTRLYKEAKRKGYSVVSYVSSKAFWISLNLIFPFLLSRFITTSFCGSASHHTARIESGPFLRKSIRSPFAL